MGRHRYPAAHWENTSRRLYRSTLWETRCSYINQPQCFSNTEYLLIAFTIIWIFRRKIKTHSIKLCTIIPKSIGKQEMQALPLIWFIWNSSINILKEIHSGTTSLKQKLLLLCGDVEAYPGPYNKGKLSSIQCDVKHSQFQQQPLVRQSIIRLTTFLLFLLRNKCFQIKRDFISIELVESTLLNIEICQQY